MAIASVRVPSPEQSPVITIEEEAARAFHDMLVTIRANVAALKQQGKSLDQIVAAKPSAAYDEKWGGFVVDPAFFTRLVYRGV